MRSTPAIPGRLSITRAQQKFLFALLVTAGLTGCAPPIQPVLAPAQFKSVAVLSLEPNTFSLGHIGFTVFQNDFAVVPLDWDVNAAITERAEDILKAKYEIRPLKINSADFIATVQSRQTIMTYIITSGLVGDHLKETIKPGLADLIVVIDGTIVNKASDLSVTDPGTGLVYRSHFPDAGGYVGLMSTFEVFDGNTFKLLANNYSGQGTGETVSFDWKGDDLSAISGTTQAMLKDAQTIAIQNYLNAALRTAGLAD